VPHKPPRAWFTFKPFSTHRLRKLSKIAQPRPGRLINFESGTPLANLLWNVCSISAEPLLAAQIVSSEWLQNPDRDEEVLSEGEKRAQRPGLVIPTLAS